LVEPPGAPRPILKKGIELMAKKKRARGAVTGQYVTEAYAKRNPRTTVMEATKPRKKKNKKRGK
jgi:hypothetical protein